MLLGNRLIGGAHASYHESGDYKGQHGKASRQVAQAFGCLFAPHTLVFEFGFAGKQLVFLLG